MLRYSELFASIYVEIDPFCVLKSIRTNYYTTNTK